MAEIILYTNPHFGGLHTHLFESTADFAQLQLFGIGLGAAYEGRYFTWNDRVSSFVIVSGVWQFFKDANFQGLEAKLGPGLYPWVGDARITRDALSSIKLVQG
jgi:hypothetical protein